MNRFTCLVLFANLARSQSWLSGAPLKNTFSYGLSLLDQRRVSSSAYSKQNVIRLPSTFQDETDASETGITDTNKLPSKVTTNDKSRHRTKTQAADGAPNQLKNDNDAEDVNGDNTDQTYNIPTSGVSLSDSMTVREEFITTLTPILNIGTNGEKEHDIIYDEKGVPIGVKKAKEDLNQQQHDGVARIDAVSTSGNLGEEPVRWLVSLKDPNENDDDCLSYFMIDIPPYSDQLANEIKGFMDPNYNNTQGDASIVKGKLDAILVTNKECIHYDQSPGVYVTRTSDLEKWKDAFPDVKVIIYRLDQPRECKESVTQVLDGYGPWGWDENSDDGFIETGRPLRMEEWDATTVSNVLNIGDAPPDDSETIDSNDNNAVEDEALYSKEAIREREDNHHLLAVYTPGHTFGSITYVFPRRALCCSGYALPLESASETIEGYDDEDGKSYSTPITPEGPRLDYQGYLATSVSRPRQMSSASKLIHDYIDRFKVVMPSRGDVVFLDSITDKRKKDLMENVGTYRNITDIYERLGISE